VLSFFTYPHQLTAALKARGYQNNDLPITREWIGLVHEFRKARYSPERAAEVIDAAFSRDPEALGEACAIAGGYAMAVFAP
jgi:hypothetical protein